MTAKAGTTLASFAYTYTPNSYVASKTQKVGTNTQQAITYSYDGLGRLTKSTGNALPSTYIYDAVGNRVQWSATDDPTTAKPDDAFVQKNTYNLAGQLTTSIKTRQNGAATFTDTTTNTWDANGNLVLSDTAAQAPGQSSTTAYSYDQENRLVAVGPSNHTGGVCERPGIGNDGCPPGLNKNPAPGNSGNGADKNTLLRSYDALGRLVVESAGKTATTWTHDGLNPVYASTDGPGNGANDGTATYLRDGFGDLLGQQAGKKGSVDWYITDALSSIYGTTNASGNLGKDTTDYSDYGVQLTDTTLAFGYTGERTDMSANGLVNFYARGYLPSTGNWVQPDGLRGFIEIPRSLDRYQLAVGNPSSSRDQLGYWGWRTLVGAVAGVALVAAAVVVATVASPVIAVSAMVVVGAAAAVGAGNPYVGGAIIGASVGAFFDARASGASWAESAGAGASTLLLGNQGAQVGNAVGGPKWTGSSGSGNSMYNGRNGNPSGNTVRNSPAYQRVQASGNSQPLSASRMSPIEAQSWASQRATQLQAELPTGSQGRVTMGAGVVVDANGNQIRVITTSEPGGYLRPGVSVKPGEIVVSGTGHAEADITAWAAARGYQVLSIGAGRPICADCAQSIFDSGGTAASQLR